MATKLTSASGSALPRTHAESWDFKICKKIAQLTKVVYTLNCRNEDSEERIKWLAQCHENEIQHLQQECAKQVEAAVAKIKQAEKDKTETVRSVEVDYQSAVNEARDAFADKLERITAAAEAAKENYERRLNKIQEESSIVKQEELTKLREAKDLEVSNLVKEYNDRYKSMLVEQMDIRDTMVNKLRAEWELQVKALEQELESAKSTSDAQLGAKSKQLLTEMGKTSTLERELSGVKEQLSQLEARRLVLETTNEGLQQRLNKISENLDTAEGREESLQKQLELMTKERSDAGQELEKTRQSLKEAQRQVEKLSSDCVNAKNHLEVAMSQKVTAESDLRELRKQHEELRSINDELEKQRVSLFSSMQDRSSGITQLELALEEAKKEMELLKSQNAESMRALSKSHEEALRRAEQYSQEFAASVLERCQKEMEEMKLNFQKQLHESEEVQRSRTTLLEKQNGERYDTLQNRLVEIQKEKDALQVQQATLHQERDAIQQKYDALEVEHRRHQDEMSEQHRKDDAEITRLRDMVSSLTEKGETELDAVRRALSERECKFSDEQEALRRRLEEERHKVEEDLERRLQEVAEQHRSHVAMLESQREAAERRLALSAEEHAGELQKLRAEAARALEEVKAEAESAQGALSAQLRRLESELDDLRSAGEQGKADARAEVRRLEEAAEGLRAASQAREGEHAAALRALREGADLERAAELARERQAHAREVQTMREAAEAAAAEHAREVEHLERVAAERVEREAAGWRTHLDEVQQRAESECREREAHCARELEAQLGELRSAKDGVISEYERELARATDKLQNTEQEVELVKRKLEGAEKGLIDAAEQMQKDQRKAEETLAQVRREHLEAMRRAEDEHDRQLNLLVYEHKRLSDKALLELETERRTYEMQIAQLKESYEELQHKYNYRESRPEDVNYINQLTKSNHEKDKALRKAQHDLQVYKLELINREENYNKLFGRSPVVAADTSSQRTATSLPSIRQTQRDILK